MKRIVVCVFLVSLAIGPISAQGTAAEKEPLGTVNLIIHGSLAVIGLSGELYFGPLGLGAQFSFLPLSGDWGYVILYEPGMTLRFFPFGVVNSIFLGAGATFLGVVGNVESSSLDIADKILNVNIPLGFNAFFGNQREVHLSVEIGYRLVFWPNLPWFSFPHFNLALGRAF